MREGLGLEGGRRVVRVRQLAGQFCDLVESLLLLFELNLPALEPELQP